jgi:hypothetical protein
MRKSAVLTMALFILACNPNGPFPYSPVGFPRVLSLPNTVTTNGPVSFEQDGQYEFTLQGRSEMVRGEKWVGHVIVDGFSATDRSFLATLENSLVKKTGWKSLYHDGTRKLPIATLRRTLGGEHFWVSIEGWPNNLSVTIVHRK